MVSPEQKLMRFLVEYTEVVKEHLASTRMQLDVVVEHAMDVVRDFSLVTESKKNEAQAMMEKSYLAPDSDLTKMMHYTQKTADVVFELAENGLSESPEMGASNLRDVENDMRIMAGVFSKHLESITRIENETRDVVMSMVGGLSNGDVMKQRIDHVYESLTMMNERLRMVIDALPSGLDQEKISSMKDSLLEETYRRYSMEEEKVAFKLIFGPPPHVVKAYYRRSA